MKAKAFTQNVYLIFKQLHVFFVRHVAARVLAHVLTTSFCAHPLSIFLTCHFATAGVCAALWTVFGGGGALRALARGALGWSCSATLAASIFARHIRSFPVSARSLLVVCSEFCQTLLISNWTRPEQALSKYNEGWTANLAVLFFGINFTTAVFKSVDALLEDKTHLAGIVASWPIKQYLAGLGRFARIYTSKSEDWSHDWDWKTQREDQAFHVLNLGTSSKVSNTRSNKKLEMHGASRAKTFGFWFMVGIERW
jgi:hypothetical protein